MLRRDSKQPSNDLGHSALLSAKSQYTCSNLVFDGDSVFPHNRPPRLRRVPTSGKANQRVWGWLSLAVMGAALNQLLAGQLKHGIHTQFPVEEKSG
jgi:hypothetical protein